MTSMTKSFIKMTWIINNLAGNLLIKRIETIFAKSATLRLKMKRTAVILSLKTANTHGTPIASKNQLRAQLIT
jgi:hypothetical protein